MTTSRIAPDAPPDLDALMERARRAHAAISPADAPTALVHAFEAGEALLAAKALVPHGKWGAVLASTGIAPSTAQLYMQLAKHRVLIEAAGYRASAQYR